MKIGDHQSYSVTDDCGIPQGSIMGPLLFTLYSASIYDIVKAHGLRSMIYADDIQIYLTFPAHDREVAIGCVNNCVKDIISWSTRNKLQVNASKTEFIHFTSRFAPSPPLPLVVTVDGVGIPAVGKARNLGVIMDKHLTMTDHITKTCQLAFMAIRKIGQIRQYLNRRTIEILVHALIMSHVDNCNALLYGLPKKDLNRIQRIQNTAARLVVGAPSRDSITPILKELHWLPVDKRVLFKILIMCFKAQNNLSPSYISELINQYTPVRTLRSSSQNLLSVYSVNMHSYGDRSFIASAPTLWNSLPITIRNISSLDTFKKSLKTYLFLL